jgi:mono/diheme cytochrome c family protein
MEETARGRTLRQGRQLVADLRCTKCHAVPVADDGKYAFAELAMDAPSFKDIGARLKRDWMAAWVHDPQAIRPDAHMPRVFHAGSRPAGQAADAADTRAADVAAYLASLGTPAPDPARGDAVAGERLYTALACVACHVPPGAAGAVSTEPARVSHEHVAAKFTPAGLKQYLLDPDAHYAWNPMPNFRMSDTEAGDLAAYLLAKGTKPMPVTAPNVEKGDVARGEKLLVSAGCVACHGGTEQRGTPLASQSLADMRKPEAWSRGCMAHDESARRSAPVFKLTEDQRSAIGAFLDTDRSALARDEPGEFAERQYAAMRCGNCHARDADEAALLTTLAAEHDRAYAKHFGDAKSGGAADAPAEGGVHLAPDQKRFPPLTWAGEKLRPEWAASFIAGDFAYKPRPYLRARMPAFKARAAGIAVGFATSHGVAPTSAPIPAPDVSLIPAGQKLAGTVGGFSCVQCHAVAGAPPLAPFEAPAIDFAHVAERLRKPYYDRWMHDPIAVDPTTKMPRFGDDDGLTPLRDTLDGNANKQYDAIWQYLLQGRDVKRPN